MKKIGLFLIVFLTLSEVVYGAYQPGLQARPHTICREIRRPAKGLQVFLTDLGFNSFNTRVDIYEFPSQEGRNVWSAELVAEVEDDLEIYTDHGFRLEINRQPNAGTSQRAARLHFQSEIAGETKKDLLCDSLMHPMDIGPASF